MYDATGNKIVYEKPNGNKTYYYGNFVYQQTSGSPELDYLLFSEGRIIAPESGNNYSYEYHIKDHLGNTRVVFVDENDNGIIEKANYEINQVSDYYPFGMRHDLGSSNPNEGNQKYLYNGKELQDETGWYDYGARMYDPSLGRWHVVDPMAESMNSWSPYNYTFNNPIRFVDPDGTVPGDFVDEQGKKLGNDGIDDDKVYVVKSTESGTSKSDIKATENFIEENSGNTKAFEKNSIAYDNSIEIEGSAETRQEMVNTVSGDNGKGGTAVANNREYGGTIDNNGNVTASPPGAPADPSKVSHVSVTHTVTSQTKSTFHSHPSGTKVVTSGGSSTSTGSVSSIGGGTTTTYSYTQTPSATDINNAGSRTNYVFGKGNSTVYIYNSSGTQATIPEKRFVNFKK